MRGSSLADAPPRRKRSGVCGLLGDDLGSPPLLAGDEASEAFKEFCSPAGARHEDVAAIPLVPFAAQIAEAAQRIQGACDHGLRYAENGGEPAYRMRAVGSIDQQE